MLSTAMTRQEHVETWLFIKNIKLYDFPYLLTLTNFMKSFAKKGFNI